MLFGVMPITSSSVNTVEEVCIFNYEYPLIGITPADMPKLDVPENADYVLDDVCWCLDSTKEELGMDEPFVEGTRYCLMVRILPAENCAFSPYVSIDLSGYVDQGEFLVRPYEIIMYAPAVTPFAGRISEIVINGFKLPEPGQACNLLPQPNVPEDAQYAAAFFWFNEVSGSVTGSGDTFLPTCVYSFVAVIEPNDGYCFADGVKIAINGDDVTVDEGRSMIKKDYIELWSKPIYLIPEDVEFITNIDASGVSIPVAGQTCAENVAAVTVSDQCSIAYIGWVDVGRSYVMEPDDVFYMGSVYYMYINLTAADGYAFDPLSLPDTTINGDTELLAVGYTFLGFNDGQAMLAFFTEDITPLPNPDTTPVTEVDLTDFAIPKVGQTAAENLASFTISDGCEITSKMWVNGTLNAVMNDDDVFASDYVYYLNVGVTPAEGFYFDPDNLPDVYINGEKTFVYPKTRFTCDDSGRPLFIF